MSFILKIENIAKSSKISNSGEGLTIKNWDLTRMTRLTRLTTLITFKNSQNWENILFNLIIDIVRNWVKASFFQDSYYHGN